jgi:NNP family nitrate/nitrite transporter-like MFS transporter
VPYYVAVFGVSLATAGLLTAIFSFPSGVVRALGGWLSDRYGARKTMYGVLGCCTVGCLLLSVPRMQVLTAGESAFAKLGGQVTSVTADEITVGKAVYPIKHEVAAADSNTLFGLSVAHQPVVKVGDKVVKKQLLAKGTSTLTFNPGIEFFTFLVFVVGIAMGVGKAAVYKHIPDYFPEQVGAVGGLVGVIGGLGGFVCPILFGHLLRSTGVWSSAWFFLFLLSAVSLTWMHSVVRGLERRRMLAIEARADAARPVARELGDSRQGALS